MAKRKIPQPISFPQPQTKQPEDALAERLELALGLLAITLNNVLHASREMREVKYLYNQQKEKTCSHPQLTIISASTSRSAPIPGIGRLTKAGTPDRRYSFNKTSGSISATAARSKASAWKYGDPPENGPFWFEDKELPY